MFANAFQDKTVWVSGHTGFKGSWLCEWLLRLGARVHGFSLPPPTTPAMFDQLKLGTRLAHETGDIRDAGAVRESLTAAQPDFVFHLAAQSLVRRSYADPVDTYASNVMGTIHVLDALRLLGKPCAAVFVTTDKCYENRDWLHGYRENDPLGGYDPYSSSKACAELAIASWRQSFFASHPVRIASARAGNVIGGGDWAADRIVPDCVRTLQQDLPVPVRSPHAIRPWQHVLEPLSGYLWLAACLSASRHTPGSDLATAFNFGPCHSSNRTVTELVTEVLRHWPGHWEDRSAPGAVHEARTLTLAIDKAHALLGWQPVWRFEQVVEHTVMWYREAGTTPDRAAELTTRQIETYENDAATAGVAWATAGPNAICVGEPRTTVSGHPDRPERPISLHRTTRNSYA